MVEDRVGQWVRHRTNSQPVNYELTHIKTYFDLSYSRTKQAFWPSYFSSKPDWTLMGLYLTSSLFSGVNQIYSIFSMAVLPSMPYNLSQHAVIVLETTIAQIPFWGWMSLMLICLVEP